MSELKMPLYAFCEITHSEVIANLAEVKEIATAMQDKELSHGSAEQSPDIAPTTVKYY